MPPGQEYTRKSGGIHQQDEHWICHTHLAENSDHLVIKEYEQDSNSPGYSEGYCQKWNDGFGFQGILLFSVLIFNLTHAIKNL
jgi:hypothetical protein